MKKHWLFYSFFLILIAVSCKKKETAPVDLKYDYFQLVEGAFVEYDVTYIFHDVALLKHDTINYQIKTQIGDTVIDNSGRIARKFNRYVRETSADSWILKDVWTAIIVDGRAELVEENQRKVKLLFAPTEDKTWNINQFNMGETMNASYDSLDVARTIQNLAFDKTLIVREQKYTTLIDKIEKYEIYARGVGMIFKQDIDLTYNFGEAIPKKGTEYYYQINNYGIE
jgi:hypothetical protein